MPKTEIVKALTGVFNLRCLKFPLIILTVFTFNTIANSQSTYEYEGIELKKEDYNVNKLILTDSDILMHSARKMELHKGNRTLNRYSTFNADFERLKSSEVDKSKYQIYDVYPFKGGNLIFSIEKVKKNEIVRVIKLNDDLSKTELFSHTLEKGQKSLTMDVTYSPDSTYLQATVCLYRGMIYNNDEVLFLVVDSNLEVKMKPIINIEEQANCTAISVFNPKVTNEGKTLLYINAKRSPKQLKAMNLRHVGEPAYRHELWIVDDGVSQIVPTTELMPFSVQGSIYMLPDGNVATSYVERYKVKGSDDLESVLKWSVYNSDGELLKQNDILIEPAFLADVTTKNKLKKIRISPSFRYILDDNKLYFYLKSELDYVQQSPHTMITGAGTYTYGLLLVSVEDGVPSIQKTIPTFSVTAMQFMTDPIFIKNQDDVLLCYNDLTRNSENSFDDSDSFYKSFKKFTNNSLNILNLSNPDGDRIVVKESDSMVVCLNSIVVDNYLYFITINGKLSLKYSINKVLLN